MCDSPLERGTKHRIRLIASPILETRKNTFDNQWLIMANLQVADFNAYLKNTSRCEM